MSFSSLNCDRRGMVGSVLLERMTEESDWEHMKTVFFTTSQAGQPGPVVGKAGVSKPLVDTRDLEALSSCAVVVSCQGGDYMEDVHPKLRCVSVTFPSLSD